MNRFIWKRKKKMMNVKIERKKMQREIYQYCIIS